MQLTEQRVGDALLLKTSGRIDRTTADPFKAALQPYLDQCKPGQVIVLDFSGIDYISSVGFQVLLVAQKRAKAQQGAVVLAALQPGVKSIFEIANFSKVIRCYDTVDSAVAATAAMRADSAPGT